MRNMIEDIIFWVTVGLTLMMLFITFGAQA